MLQEKYRPAVRPAPVNMRQSAFTGGRASIQDRNRLARLRRGQSRQTRQADRMSVFARQQQKRQNSRAGVDKANGAAQAMAANNGYRGAAKTQAVGRDLSAQRTRAGTQGASQRQGFQGNSARQTPFASTQRRTR